MKYMPLMFIVSLFFLVACQEKSTKSTNTTNNNSSALQNCQYGQNYWVMPGCLGYCQMNPTNPLCIGNTTSGTTGGSGSGGGGGGIITNPYPNYPSSPVNTQWQGKYPGGVPSGSCSQTYNPTGINFTPYETRKATMTIVGKTWYNPADGNAPNYTNTSSLLKSINGARQLFQTDAALKVRFKVIPQPESSNSSPYCYGRTSGTSIAGYTKLQYNVQLVGANSYGQTFTEPLGTFTTNVNSCSPAIDLSTYASKYPGGIYVIVQAVKGNQGFFPNDYDFNGFKNVNQFVDIRSQDCWVLDVEVSADGTKTFD